MKKIVAKLGMLAVLSGAFIAVSHATTSAPQDVSCCSSGGSICCGSACTAHGGKCSAQ